MKIGWIKLHRKIQDCDIWDSEEEPFDRRSAWIDLLLLANHEDKKIIFNGNIVVVKAGQRITSIRKLAARWNWSNDRVRRFLSLLETDNMIVKESDNRRTLLTIVNYGFYQGQCDTDEYTDKYTNGTPTSTQTSHKQEYIKNDKEVKNIYGEYKHVRLKPSEYEKLVNEYGDKAQVYITFLDEYIEMKGYKAKNHYLAVKKWVVDAVKEKEAKGQPKKNGFNNIQKTEYDFADLEKKLLSQ